MFIEQERVASATFPEGHRQNQRDLASRQLEHMAHALLGDPVGHVGNDVVRRLGDGEQVAHLAEAAIDDIAAARRDAAGEVGRDDGADAAARIEHVAFEGFNVQQQLDTPARLDVEVLINSLVAGAARIALVATARLAWQREKKLVVRCDPSFAMRVFAAPRSGAPARRSAGARRAARSHRSRRG